VYKEDIELIRLNREAAPLDDETAKKHQQFVEKINNLALSSTNNYRAELIFEGRPEQHVLLRVNLGKDTVYFVIDNKIQFDETSSLVGWQPSDWGLISATGKTVSISRLLNSGLFTKNQIQNMMMFYDGEDLQPELSSAGLILTQASYSSIILPKNTEELGIAFHELAHMLKAERDKSQDNIMYVHAIVRNAIRVLKVYPDIVNIKDFSLAGIDLYRLRRIVENEERSASAFSIAILRELNKQTGLEAGENENIKKIIRRIQFALATYMKLPYQLQNHKQEHTIPGFTNEQRKAARELHKRVKKEGLEYKDLHSYDTQTGENIANQPDKITTLV
jgi:hypothetical protein